MNKPPLGLVPRTISEQQYCLERASKIIMAMNRYHEANYPVPAHWEVEINELHQWYDRLCAQMTQRD